MTVASADGPRIIVIGTSGAGKTTLAGRISARLGIDHIEIDALYHGPGWTPRPEFLADVRALAAGAARRTAALAGRDRGLARDSHRLSQHTSVRVAISPMSRTRPNSSGGSSGRSRSRKSIVMVGPRYPR